MFTFHCCQYQSLKLIYLTLSKVNLSFKMVYTSSSELKDRYRGCLVGAAVGDCLGARFEGLDLGSFTKDEVVEQINYSEKQEVDLRFTDDTQMTQEIADSLIENSGFIAKDLAERFVNRYYTDGINVPYGANVVHVFRKLRESNFADPFLPASEQFGGTGSYGNGAAMRVAPVALFCLDSAKNAARLAELTAVITHTHEEAIIGAVFQCLAIRRCLLHPVTDIKEFLEGFKTDLAEVKISAKYREKLNVIERLLDGDKVKCSLVVESLGNGIAAIKSVPTALFCFLRGLKPIPGFHSTDPFRRIMEYTINLGGDTDTIACMAGAIAGANFGLSGINIGTWNSCEQVDRIIKQADDLYEKLTQVL